MLINMIIVMVRMITCTLVKSSENKHSKTKQFRAIIRPVGLRLLDMRNHENTEKYPGLGERLKKIGCIYMYACHFMHCVETFLILQYFLSVRLAQRTHLYIFTLCVAYTRLQYFMILIQFFVGGIICESDNIIAAILFCRRCTG